MDDTTGLTLLAAAFGIGLIVWLLKGQSGESPNFDKDISDHRQKQAEKKANQHAQSKPKKVVKITKNNSADGSEAELRKAKERERAKKRREDALAAKKAADEKKRLQNEEKFAAWDNLKYQKLKEGFDKHKPILVNNMANAIFINEYGHTEKDNRLEEWNRFLTSVGYPIGSRAITNDPFKPFDKIYARRPKNYSKLTDPNYKTKSKLTWEIEATFAKELLKELEAYKAVSMSTDFNPDTHPENGHDFENWVAEHLQRFGWNTKVTTGSGDQGVDIIASFEGQTVGIQCKRFKKPVGNKAVQEIAAGAKHYGLTHAMVIGTGGYTKSAKELATSTGVLLVSHRDIPSLSKLIKS